MITERNYERGGDLYIYLYILHIHDFTYIIFLKALDVRITYDSKYDGLGKINYNYGCLVCNFNVARRRYKFKE